MTHTRGSNKRYGAKMMPRIPSVSSQEQATKQSNLFFAASKLDCFAEPVIGRAFARPVRLQWRGDHPLPRALIERLAQRYIALLLLGPVATAGDGAVHHQIMPIDKAGFVAGEKHRGVRDIFRQAGARYRLR